MKKTLLILSLLGFAACRSASLPQPSAEPVEVYERAVLANQECYRQFDRIERRETITVINRDSEGNVQKYPREEVDYDIVELANTRHDPSGLLGVTVHPFFSERDTFTVEGVRDSTVFVRVASADPDVRHYLDDIVLQMRLTDHIITRLTAEVLIHGYGRDGRSVNRERMVSDWERERGCDLPQHVRHHSARDTLLQRPRLTINTRYRFIGAPSGGGS